ncbi:hypothetical protein [Deinococcus sp. UYEF24]
MAGRWDVADQSEHSERDGQQQLSPAGHWALEVRIVQEEWEALEQRLSKVMRRRLPSSAVRYALADWTRHLSRLPAGQEPSEVEVATAYLSAFWASGVAPGSLRRRRRLLDWFYGQLVSSGARSSNPFEGLQVLEILRQPQDQDRPAPPAYPPDTSHEMLGGPLDHLESGLEPGRLGLRQAQLAMTVLLLSGGVPYRALPRLRWMDLDPESGTVHLGAGAILPLPQGYAHVMALYTRLPFTRVSAAGSLLPVSSHQSLEDRLSRLFAERRLEWQGLEALSSLRALNGEDLAALHQALSGLLRPS